MNKENIFHSTTIILYNSSKTIVQDYNFTNGTNVLIGENNWWALTALVLAASTAAGNILVCLAICWERRLQNVTNYFLMSLAVTDLMVAILVMPLGIVTLVRGRFPLPSIYCLTWICLDVLFCTASIMHLCTISVDRFLSLRYPMKFGRNKSRRRVILKIIFVWLLSIAMSLPLSLMYSKDQGSLIIDGTCQIPDPLYKLIGSIVSFYIPLLVMLVTYALTVRLLAQQQQNLSAPNWTSNWMGGLSGTPLERRCTWKKFLSRGQNHKLTTPQHAHSATSTDTELTTIDTHELWIQESEPMPCTMSALGQFGAEMLKLSRGLEAASQLNATSFIKNNDAEDRLPKIVALQVKEKYKLDLQTQNSNIISQPWATKRRRATTFHEGDTRDEFPIPKWRNRSASVYELQRTFTETGNKKNDLKRPLENDSLQLPPPCTCPYFGERQDNNKPSNSAEIKIISSKQLGNKLTLDPGNISSEQNSPLISPEKRSLRPSIKSSGDSSPNTIVTWKFSKRHRRGSSFGHIKGAALINSGNQRTPLMLRRSTTLRNNGDNVNTITMRDRYKNPSTPCLSLGRSGSTGKRSVRSHHSRNSSVISRNSSRHGRIIRLEQKATKVLGVVFFTFVILWAPFFILNLLPAFCADCEKNMGNWVMQLVTWLGYASSMVNPIFYTIFNKVFRQAFKKVLLCRYRKTSWRPHR